MIVDTVVIVLIVRVMCGDDISGGLIINGNRSIQIKVVAENVSIVLHTADRVGGEVCIARR